MQQSEVFSVLCRCRQTVSLSKLTSSPAVGGPPILSHSNWSNRKLREGTRRRARDEMSLSTLDPIHHTHAPGEGQMTALNMQSLSIRVGLSGWWPQRCGEAVSPAGLQYMVPRYAFGDGPGKKNYRDVPSLGLFLSAVSITTGLWNGNERRAAL